MKTLSSALLAISLASVPLAHQAAAQETPQFTAAADAALQADRLAWDFVEGLTSEVGPRQAGTEAEARGRAWAARWLEKHGFARVTIEPFAMQTWVPGENYRAEILAPFVQPLAIAPLGGSAATGEEGIAAPVVFFRDVEALRAAPDGSLAGKIAYISHQMRPSQDGSHYGFAGPARWVGAGIAASKGAIASVIKSVGTDHHRNPHTGGTGFPEGVAPIPAGAISVPDAENLERMFARSGGREIVMKLVLNPRDLGTTQSGNLVAEITGRDPSLPPVLLACHIDSWWPGTGAVDDGAGCGIIAAAALNATADGPRLRTIRLLMAGAEETGLWGSKAYASAHANEPVGVALESDFGADRIWRFESNFAQTNPALHGRIARAIARFGVADSAIVATGGADINIAREQGAAIIDLQQDGMRYFDLHHTPDDTLDKIDPAQLRQNVAVWTEVVAILADTKGPIKGEGSGAD